MNSLKTLGLKILVTISFLTLSSLSFAIDFEDAVFPELATSARALSMGNAYVAKADDASAVYYNPAGLGTVRKTHFHLSNFHIEVNKGWISNSTKGNVLDVVPETMNAFSLEGQRDKLLSNKGSISNQRFNFLPNFTTRYFSLGYLVSKRTKATIGQEVGAKFEYAERTDHGPYAALNISLFGGVFKIGASATYLNRKEVIGESDANVEYEENPNEIKKGSALIVVSGAKLTFPIKFLPTFAVKMNNALSEDFSEGSTNGAPTNVLNSLDFGFSLTPQMGRVVRLHLEANYKDLSGMYEGISSSRRLTFGMEIDIARKFFIRAGYGDGWGSGGIGIKSQRLEFDLTTYAVDTTTNEFRGAEDRRFVLSFSYGL